MINRTIAFWTTYWSFGYSLRLWATAAFLIAIGMAPGLSKAQEGTAAAGDAARSSGMDPEKLALAVPVAKSISATAWAIDRERRDYTEEEVQQIRTFYRYGSATKEEPGDAVVTQKFCRDFVLALLWDAFLVELSPEGEPITEPEGFQNPLTPGSTARLHALLTEIIRTAHVDLSFIRRTRLYRLAAMARGPEGTDVVDALNSLASQPEIHKYERELIDDAIYQIERRG